MGEEEKHVKKIVRTLKNLEKQWPEGYMLFSNSGTLGLWKGSPCEDGEEIASFLGIPNDGGEP